MSQTKSQVIILGGGVAGMAAAQTLDQIGIGVHLVERQADLGGHASQWACMATDQCRHCGACLSAELADQIRQRSRVNVHLNTTATRLKKKEGFFQADLTGPAEESVQAAAVLLATGFAPFHPDSIPELGYGVYDRVITTADLNALLKQEALSGILPDSPAPAIAFIQCVGSRNQKLGRDYCSQICCKTAVRQAEKILHLMPDTAITIFHMDLQVIGKVFRTQAAELASKVVLRQGVSAKILNHLQEGKLSVMYEDGQTGARTAAHFDLVVLAVGMEPAAGLRDLTGSLGIQPDDWGFIGGLGRDASAGVYTTGSAGGPVDIITARDQGVAAAHRIARDLGYDLPGYDRQPVAILGGTAEAHELAQALVQDHYPVLMLDPDGRQVMEGQGMTYYGPAGLERVEGTLGNFQLTFNSMGKTSRAKTAAIVVALGADEWPSELPSTGFSRAVQSLSDFSREFEADPSALPDSIAFWLDRNGQEWKTNARRCLEMALALRRQAKSVIVIMEKMLVHGLTGQRLYDQARHAGVRFLRVRDAAAVVVAATDTGVDLELEEATLPGVPVTVHCRRLVLPGLVRPSILTAPIAQLLGQSLDVEGFIQSANVRHRPVGSPRRGIFFIGSCHDETDPTDIVAEVRSLKASLAIFPGTGQPLDDPPLINEGECVRCLTCLRVCPHTAVVLRDGFQPQIVPEACFGCGICVSSCPARAIKPAAAEPADAPPVGRTVVFACQRSAFLAAREAGLTDAGPDPAVTIVAVPCAGRLDQVTLLQPLLEGAEKVIVAGCYEGNCRSIIGSRTAGTRARQMAAAIQDLDQAVGHFGIAANEPQKMMRIIGETGSREEKTHA